MGIYEKWLETAYDQRGGLVETVWSVHLPLEQAVYEKMLSTKNNAIKGKFGDLATEYGMSHESMVGFLDGISGALDKPLDMDEVTEDTEIDVKVDFETLYKKMVEYKAEHLVDLPEWDNIFPADERKRMFIEQKKSGTVVVEQKIGRNDPCVCNSGKKYKKCCGV